MSHAAIVLVKGLVLVVALLLAAAYMTFCERILMARVQLRLGPNRTGPLGLMQPIADGLKLVFKERFRPLQVDVFTYWLAPALSLFVALFAFVVIPVGGTIQVWGHSVKLRMADVDSGVVFLLAVLSLSVYGVVLAGWSSNNRYSLLGALRATAQMISYEVPMGLSLLTVVLLAGTLRLPAIVEAQREGWFIWTNPLGFLIFLMTSFAETNRAPFDLPEAEQELTAGYHTEYGGLKFAMFFLAEYVSILVVSSTAVTLFFGGWLGPWNLPVLWFLMKVAVFVFFFMWVRATLPRFRYDQLMSFSWKVLVPLATLNLIVTAYFILV